MNKRQQFQTLLNKETSESLGGSQKNALLEPYAADSEEARLDEQAIMETKVTPSKESESDMKHNTDVSPTTEPATEQEPYLTMEQSQITETFTEQKMEHDSVGSPQTSTDPFAKLRQKRKKREELSTRSTFMIDNDLLTRLTRISRGRGKGFKYQFVNAALRMALDMFEQNE